MYSGNVRCCVVVCVSVCVYLSNPRRAFRLQHHYHPLSKFCFVEHQASSSALIIAKMNTSTSVSRVWRLIHSMLSLRRIFTLSVPGYISSANCDLMIITSPLKLQTWTLYLIFIKNSNFFNKALRTTSSPWPSHPLTTGAWREPRQKIPFSSMISSQGKSEKVNLFENELILNCFFAERGQLPRQPQLRRTKSPSG